MMSVIAAADRWILIHLVDSSHSESINSIIHLGRSDCACKLATAMMVVAVVKAAAAVIAWIIVIVVVAAVLHSKVFIESITILDCLSAVDSIKNHSYH